MTPEQHTTALRIACSIAAVDDPEDNDSYCRYCAGDLLPPSSMALRYRTTAGEGHRVDCVWVASQALVAEMEDSHA